MLGGRGDQFTGAIIAADAVTASGERGMDWKQVSLVTAEWAFISGRCGGPTSLLGKRRAYRMMHALEATGLFEILGDESNSNPATRRRVRRIRAGQSSPPKGAA